MNNSISPGPSSTHRADVLKDLKSKGLLLSLKQEEKVSSVLLTKDFIAAKPAAFLLVCIWRRRKQRSECKRWECSRNAKASDHSVFTYEQPESAYCDLCAFIISRIILKRLFHLICIIFLIEFLNTEFAVWRIIFRLEVLWS